MKKLTPILFIIFAGCAVIPRARVCPDVQEFRELARPATVIRFQRPYPEQDKARLLFSLDDPDEIQYFISRIDIIPSDEVWMCECAGYPIVQFLNGTNFLCELSVHHGRSLRSRTWGDKEMTPRCAEWLSDWLEAKGIPEPR